MDEKDHKGRNNSSANQQPVALNKTVSDLEQLNEYIKHCNEFNNPQDSMTITLNKDITLSGPIQIINTVGVLTINNSIAGSNGLATVDGKSNYHGFRILCGTVNLTNLSIQNMTLNAYDGCLAAGAGLFIANVSNAQTSKGKNPYGPKSNSAPTVTLSDVSFSNCYVNGGNGRPGGIGGAGGSGGVGGDTDGGNGLNSSVSPINGNSLFDTPIVPGYFGVFGPNNCVGNGGQGGQYYNQGPINGNQGSAGEEGGGQGGYGGGASSGSGGGGGGGGTGATWSPGGTGGAGGAGSAKGGTFGFGGGSYSSGTSTVGKPGANGTIQGEYTGVGGVGGQGGQGVNGGGGAALGGAIFVMNNATLIIGGQDSASIAKGMASGGSSDGASQNGLEAGIGCFLHGSGTLNLNPEGTFTISDSISDETGTGKKGTTGKGPDGMFLGGGGVWGLKMNGSGTLVLSGKHSFSGLINVAKGILSLTKYQNPSNNNLTLTGTLQFLPTQSAKLNFGNLTLNPNCSLHINGYSSIDVDSIVVTTSSPTLQLTISIDDVGFQAGTGVQILTSNTSMPTIDLASVSGFTISQTTDMKGIVVTKTSN